MDESLKEIISRLWVARENAEWIPKTDVLLLNELQKWMANNNIEILGFVHAMLHDGRFPTSPTPKSTSAVISFTMHYNIASAFCYPADEILKISKAVAPVVLTEERAHRCD